MIRKYYSVFGPLLRLSDVVILFATWMLAYYLRKEVPLSFMHSALPPLSHYFGVGVFILLLWSSVFSVYGLYSGKRISRRTVEAIQVLKAHTISLWLLIGLTFLFSTYRLSRGVFVYFGFSSAFLLVWSRLFFRNSLRRLHLRGIHLQNILIAGTGRTAVNTYQKLKRHPELGLRFVGFLGPDGIPANEPRFVDNMPVIGSYAQASQMVHQYKVDKLMIALPQAEYQAADELLKGLKDEVIQIVLVPDLHEYLTLGCEVEEFDGLAMVSLNSTPLEGMGIYLKRILDLLLSSLAIFVFSPLMLMIAIATKLTSPGPVFYFQERMSLNGRKFKMFKFRSMRVDQAGDVDLLTKKHDPRVTKVGEFLRRTSLDELPQFFNVFIGNMSLVGPRPERTWVVEKLREEIPSYMLKHRVKAGITGWAQVNGWRGDTSLEKRIEFDLFYIRNWSITLDLKILFLTVFRGFINKNAY